MLDIGLRAFFALIFIGSGIYHLVNPNFFMPLMPEWLPAHRPLVILSGLVEIAVGVCLFIPSVRQLAVWGVIALLIVFIPIHIDDLQKDTPVVGSKNNAIGRLIMQFVMIGAAAFIAF